MKICIFSFILIIVMLQTNALLFPKLKKNRTARYYKPTKFNQLYLDLKQERIIPDATYSVFDDVLKEVYHKNGTFKIRMNDWLTRDYVYDQPIINFQKKSTKFYTIIVHNIDAETIYDDPDKNWSPFIVVNIHSSKKLGNSSGEVLSPYKIPKVPHLKSKTRLVYFVYDQPGNMSFAELRNKTFTSDFDLLKFADKYELLTPVYGTFVWIMERWELNVTVPSPTTTLRTMVPFSSELISSSENCSLESL